MSLPDLSRLQNSLQEAAYLSSAWQQFAELMVEEFQLHVCHLFIVNKRSFAIRFHVDGGERVPTVLAEQYVQQNIQHDYLLSRLIHGERDRFHSISQAPDRELFFSGQHYQQWVAPQGLRDSAGACIYQSQDWLGIVMCNRHERHGDFTVSQLAALNQLLPQLQQSAERAFGEQQNADVRLAALVHTFRIPVCILTETGKICAQNQPMQDFIEQQSALHCEQGCLRLTDRRQENLLYIGLMQSAKRCEGYHLNIEAAEQIELAPGITAAYQPLLLPNSDQPVGIMLYLLGHSLIRPLPTERLMALFLLSAKEASISRRLAMGVSVKEIADNDCISINTVKFHIKNIFRKTGCSSQMALVNLLNSVPYSEI